MSLAKTFKVVSPNTKYTDAQITSTYQYQTTRCKEVDGEVLVEPVTKTYTFQTERKVPKLGYVVCSFPSVSGWTRENLGWEIFADKY